MKNTISLLFALSTLLVLSFSQAAAQSCTFTLQMHDSFGDGWNDGILTVNNGGVLTLFTMVEDIGDGMDSTVQFTVMDGLPLILSWTPGDYDSEVSFTLLNNDGDVLYSTSSPAATILYLTVANCIECLKPLHVQAENIYDTRIKLRWSPGYGTNTPVGWRVIYGTTGFTPGPGAGDTMYVTTPKATITGLTKKTTYDFYVQQDCGNDQSGKLTGPYTFETYYTHDVGVTGLINPENSCDLETEKVSFVLTNFGAEPQTFIRYNYSVNGVPAGVSMPQDGLYTGVIGKDQSETIEFETQFDFSAPGEYLIAVWTELYLVNDENTSNDTAYFRVVNRQVVPYEQDFEAWEGGWYTAQDSTTRNPSWEFGTPANNFIAAAASGQHAWVTNLDGRYNASERSYLYSPCFDFSDQTEDPVFECSIIFSTETLYDGAWLEMSLDDGASWSRVGAIDEGLNWFNISGSANGLGDVWAGNSGGWIRARHHLTGTAGQARVLLRFAFGSDAFAQFEGVGIDDIRIYQPLTDDLAAVSVSTEGDAVECGLETDRVTFRFANFGSQPKTLFEVSYSLNGAAPVTENVGAVTIDPDKTFEYTFSQTFDSRDGAFAIRCWTLLATEQDPSNDSTEIYLVDHLPGPIPFQENFNNGQVPAGWTTDGFVTSGHNNISPVLAANLYEFNPDGITDLPRVGFIGPDDTLRFDYRITDFNNNGTSATTLANGTRFEVQVSTDCGETFQTVYTIDENNHTPTLSLRTVKVGLGAFAGQAVKIRFNSIWGAGDFYFDLDNINLLACPPDMQLSVSTVPADPGSSNGSATVTVGLGNPPYNYLWSTGATTATATGLPTGTATVTVTDAQGCSDMLTVQIGNSPTRSIEGLTRLTLQPNPTSATATLQAQFDRTIDLKVTVFDLLGRVLWQQDFDRTNTVDARLDLDQHPDGVYFVRLATEGQSLTKRLLKTAGHR
ncbi:MAG: T9SS type A sorting domain-containing protein [Bacteroidetes bacterium]|nr:MAG: T9SS type A sorting domain-containing protein [Bacteroidota bacterium]